MNYEDETGFNDQSRLDSAYLVYKTLSEEGMPEKDALQYAGLTQEDLMIILENELKDLGGLDEDESANDKDKESEEEEDVWDQPLDEEDY